MKKIKIVEMLVLFLLVFNLVLARGFGVNIFASQDTYFIIVDLDDHTMYVLKNDEVYKTYPVSGGTYYTPSPIGTWKIISKADWGEGFGGTWMGLNVPWGKYGIHGTDEPWSIGRPLSKGCIRMYNDDAKELRKFIPMGTEVKIIKGPYGPFGAGLRTLEPGDIGADVYALQVMLKEQGYYQGWADGKYGTGMQTAVYKFQKDHGLYVSKYITEEFYDALGVVLFE